MTAAVLSWPLTAKAIPLWVITATVVVAYAALPILKKWWKIDSPVHSHDKQLQELRNQVRSLRSDIGYLRGAVDTVIRQTSPDAMSKAQSPVALTDYGREPANQLPWDRILSSSEQNTVDEVAFRKGTHKANIPLYPRDPDPSSALTALSLKTSQIPYPKRAFAKTVLPGAICIFVTHFTDLPARIADTIPELS